jgi:hypothetical protein
VDNFAEAFGGFDPPGDPDGALEFALTAILMGDRLDELSSILTDGNEIGALEGEPGWPLQQRDSRPSSERAACRSWPQGAMFRAYVDPDQFRLVHSETFVSRDALRGYMRNALAAYVARNPSKEDAACAVSSLAE